MPDREKVIKGLECCIKRDPDDQTRCGECPYESACLNRLKIDALELLKEQETEIRQLKLALDIAKGTCKGIVFKTDEKFMGDL